MRVFMTLLRREARDARAITIALALIAPLALLAGEELAAHYTYGHLTARYAVPGAVALYAAILASDLVSAEVSTRRINALAALPVGLDRVWKSKATFLVLATLSFAGWMYGTTAALYATRAAPDLSWAFFDNTGAALLGSLAALPLGFSVLFFSTLLPRGFAAALAGALSIGAVTTALAGIDYRLHEIGQSAAEQIVVGAPTLVGLLFLAGSYVAFTRGPIHAGSALRKTSLAFAIPLAILVPGTAAALAASRAHTSLAPGDEAAEIRNMSRSPDGRHLALDVGKRGQRRGRVWVLDLADGSLAIAPGGNVHAGRSPWQSDGTVLVWESDEINAHTARWIDAETAHVHKTRSRSQFETESGRQTTETAAATSSGAWCSNYAHTWDQSAREWVTQFDWNGETRLFRGWGGVALTTTPGRVLIGREGELVLHDLATETDVYSIAGKGTLGGQLIAGGKYVHVSARNGRSTECRVADAATGATIAGPWTYVFGNPADPACAEPSGTYCSVFGNLGSAWIRLVELDRAERGVSLLNVETGARVDLGTPPDGGPNVGCLLDDGVLAVAHAGRLTLLDPQGVVVKTYLR